MFRRFFLCFARPSQPQRSIQDMGQNEQATTKIVLDRLIRIVYPKETTSQNDEHDETKTVQQKWFRKVCATYHPIFAADAHACGKALNYFFLGQLSQSSQSTAIPGNSLKQLCVLQCETVVWMPNQTICKLERRPTPTSFFRSFCSWCPANHCNPQSPNQWLHDAFGIVQHYSSEFAMCPKAMTSNQVAQPERSWNRKKSIAISRKRAALSTHAYIIFVKICPNHLQTMWNFIFWSPLQLSHQQHAQVLVCGCSV